MKQIREAALGRMTVQVRFDAPARLLSSPVGQRLGQFPVAELGRRVAVVVHAENCCAPRKSQPAGLGGTTDSA